MIRGRAEMNPLTGSVVSLNTGKPRRFAHEGRLWESGIMKQAVEGRVFLSRLNFEGDGQADLEHHGGPDKAVCVYSAEHYPYWRMELQRAIGPAAFGENLTVEGLTEEQVRIGDTFRVGEAVVQVSQPRQPCHKLAKKYDVTDMPVMVQNTGYTGYYFRVLQEGYVQTGDKVSLIQRSGFEITVAYANRIWHHYKQDEYGIRRILEVPELSDSWRTALQARLDSFSAM